MQLRRLAALAAFSWLTLGPAPAGAAGLYFGDRGVRPLSRGGAFVAGADDGGAVAYNPAGLAFAADAVLFDASWLQYSSKYQRKTLVKQRDPNTGEVVGEYVQTFPSVEGTSPVLPIPTLVGTHRLGTRRFTLGAGVWAPYAAITSYPELVDRRPAPQRYSLITLDGSALAIAGVYGAWRSKDAPHAPGGVALGAGLEVLGGYFQTSVVFSACVPDRFLCAPEQPDYDAASQLRVGPIVAPSGTVGVTWIALEQLRLGASFHLPFWIDAPATVRVRLPRAAPFDSAAQRGDQGRVRFDLPWTLRAGVEARPLEDTRVEAAFVLEGWSMHEDISLTPEDVALTGVEGFPPEYRVAPITLPRRFRDAYSVRLGGEQRLRVGGYALDVRAGAMFERSAIPDPWLSVTTVDLDKWTLAVGGSLHVGRWRFDGVVARVFGVPVEVDPREARITPVNPVLANPPEDPQSINGGSYSAGANVLGVGLVYRLDGEPSEKH